MLDRLTEKEQKKNYSVLYVLITCNVCATAVVANEKYSRWGCVTISF